MTYDLFNVDLELDTSSSLKSKILSSSKNGKVLNNLNFQIKSGEIIGLVGHNGAGKTSLLRLLAGIYQPTSGKVRVIGEVRPLINLSFCIFEDLSGYENIEVLARNYGIYDKKNHRRLVEDVYEFSELGDYFYKPMRLYSDGMKLRLCFAVLTSGTVENVLIDEVVSVGDTSFSEKAKNRLNSFSKRSDCVIVSSHNYELIKSWCTRIIKLDHGRVLYDGKP